jgi:hypothetical protein
MATAKKKAASTGTANTAAPRFKAGDSVRVLVGDFGTGVIKGQDADGLYLVSLDNEREGEALPVRGALLAAA